MTKNEVDGACSTYRVRGRGVYGLVEGKRKRKELLRRSSHRWEDAIKTDLREIG
jgi:hypothetical protein